jgi:glycosyltransferase involved in cell wall biosynthesis
VIAATIIVPTTGDRGPLLPYSVGSALAQTVNEVEVLVIGDGVDDTTRSIVDRLAADDERVRFFDFPKHPRRGEPHRHEVLTTEALGEIVCYLTDRDLYLPDHVAEMQRLLADADFAHTVHVSTDDAERFRNGGMCDLRRPDHRQRAADRRASIPLSMVGHTLDAYRRLPHGWRVTPPDIWTDHYMWQQWMAQPWVRVAVGRVPTVLYFNRGEHPGWSTERRLDLLQRWSERIATPEGVDQVRREIADAQWQQWAELALAASDADRRWWRRAARRARRLAGDLYRSTADTGRPRNSRGEREAPTS